MNKLVRNFKIWWREYNESSHLRAYYCAHYIPTAYLLTLLDWWLPFTHTCNKITCKIFGHKIKYDENDQGTVEDGMHLPPAECSRCGEIKL